MSVYVDPLMTSLKSAKWRHSKACHLFADTLEELHAFAAKLGLRLEWFQCRPSLMQIPFAHYDLTATRRIAAVHNGAIELDRAATVTKWRELGFMPSLSSPLPVAAKGGGE